MGRTAYSNQGFGQGGFFLQDHQAHDAEDCGSPVVEKRLPVSFMHVVLLILVVVVIRRIRRLYHRCNEQSPMQYREGVYQGEGTMKYREGVYLKSRNNASAEIISSDGNGWYTVRVRGSPEAASDGEEGEMKPTMPYRYKVHEDDLTFVTPELGEGYELEQIRKHLFERHHSDTIAEADGGGVEDGATGKLVAGFLLGDESGFLIWKHTNPKTLRGLPTTVEERVLALVVEENYCLGGSNRSMRGGRGLTSYAWILQPFVSIEEETIDGTRRALVKSSTPPTGQEIVSWFESLVLERTPALSAPLFFRAFAFGEYCSDNRPADDPLLDAFYVTFAAIQMMTGKATSEKLRSQHLEIQKAIDASFRRYGTLFDTPEGKRNMHWKALLWCLCNLFLHLGFVVRDKVPENKYQILLPNPYGDTISEQANVANILIESRADHPASYYTAYEMIMDVKDFILQSKVMDGKDLILQSKEYLSNAFRVARMGKDVAFKRSDAFYSYVFLMIETFWTPSSLWPHGEVITYQGIEERFDQAKDLKRICWDYTSERSLYHATSYQRMLKAFLKSLGIVSVLEQGSIAVSLIQFDPYVYCSARFGTSYYKPGGKFDRLATRYKCSNCSKPLSTVRNCSRCKRENYCNRDCQVNHWKNGHKRECNSMKS